MERLRRPNGAAAAALHPARDVLTAEKDGVAVLLDLRRAVYFGLDEVGTAAWRAIEKGATADDITAHVCAEFDAPEEAVRSDMQRFVDELRRQRLVVRA